MTTSSADADKPAWRV